MVNNLTTRTLQGTFSDHSPEGVEWGGPNTLGAHMDASMWDGVPYNVVGKTRQQICDWIRPSSPWVVRGLRERYHEVNPFADPVSPTIAEINDWNLEVIRHFRRILGDPTPLDHDARLYVESRWADERKFTQLWDTEYSTGTPGAGPGPCHINGSPMTDLAYDHCGAGFWPSATDRAPYISAQPYVNDYLKYPELAPETYTERKSKAEGVRWLNADVPWSIKLSQGIANWICSDGLVDHAGPYVGGADPNAPGPLRTKYGNSWWLDPTSATSVWYRGKFSN